MKTYRQYKPTIAQHRQLEKEGYAEIPYIDYFSTGGTAEGTEDFTYERWINRSGDYKRSHVAVYKPTGTFDRGGNRRWERVEIINARNAREAASIARIIYQGQEISIRQY